MAETTGVDVVYIVGPDAAREDSLRYSLRSLYKNAPRVDDVWIVGTVPTWLRGVKKLPLTPVPDKFENQRQSLTAACETSSANRVVIFNDDFFITEPLDEWPTFHLSSAAAYVEHLVSSGACGPGNTWLRAVKDTADWMAEQGHGDVRAYEAHVPLMFDRARLLDLLTDYPADRRLAVGELYAAAGAGGVGEDHGNAKVQHLDPPEFHAKVAQALPFLSSNANTFTNGLIGGYIRGMFREPSIFEGA